MADDTVKCYFEGCDSCPVERVSWHNVQEFLSRLNRLTGMSYRLPTEAEWEYAARGGQSSTGFKYSGSNNADTVGWHVGNAGGTSHPVGGKKPNELGIFDMTGNVDEWCGDWYSAGWYAASPEVNPAGPGEGMFRVIRGGCWFYDSTGLRVSDRESANPFFRYGYIGFRLCLPATDRVKSR
jgi:formylglycine-generating enzyme required for sulfatase activity